MTKRERAIKDRMWLKIKKFAITQSLADTLAASDLNEQHQEWCCYIQNKALMGMREKRQAQIHSTYFKDKIGVGYKKWIRQLQQWQELDVDSHHVLPTATTAGVAMKYWVPPAALATGVVIRDFKAKHVKPTKDKSKYPQTSPWIGFIHHNLNELSIAKELKPIVNDSVADALSHDYAKKIFHGEFNCHLGKQTTRLFHSVIQMPKEGRANLIWKTTNEPVAYEFDVKSCHPVLLLTLITNEKERRNYIRALDHDIYDVIRVERDIKDTRDGCKEEFLTFINDPLKSHTRCKKNYVYQFFHKYFSDLTEAILEHGDLALHLQNLEASIMVSEVGQCCMDRNIWYVPMHDGFLCKPEQFDEVAGFVTKAFHTATQYTVTITSKILTSSPPSHHMWGYNPPVKANPVWNQKVDAYNKRHPQHELETANAERTRMRNTRRLVMEQKRRGEADRVKLAKIHRLLSSSK